MRATTYEFGNFTVVSDIEPGYIGRYEVYETTKEYSNGTYGVVTKKKKLLLVTTNEKEAIGRANGGSKTLQTTSKFLAQKRYQVKPTNSQTNGMRAANVASVAEFDTMREYHKFMQDTPLPEGCDRWTIWDTQTNRWAVEVGGSIVKKKKSAPLYLLPFS